jgi:hypothetical protein
MEHSQGGSARMSSEVMIFENVGTFFFLQDSCRPCCKAACKNAALDALEGDIMHDKFKPAF